MVDGALSENLPRQLGRYDVVAVVSTRRHPRSTVLVGSARAASAAAPPAKVGSGLALSYSPLPANEGTTTFQKPVAIKLIAPSLVRDGDPLVAFLDAARAVTGIRHANVAQIHEVGQVDTNVFLVMDYLMGETAATLMRQLQSRGETLDFLLGAHLIAEACAGLEAAHAVGIVHGELTPHDLFVGYDGSVRVLDIGIAAARRRLAGELDGARLGLEYSSPERCRDEALDRQSDVFSLGTMLWEVNTGMSPFERAKAADTRRAICEEPIVPPGSVVPGLAEQVSTITMKALERDKAKRYTSALALRQALIALKRTLGATGSPTLDLSKLMKRLFETRARDKAEMLRRINAGSSIAGLDVRDADEPGAEGPPSVSSVVAAVETKPSEQDRAPITMAPPKSIPPKLVELDSPSVIIKHTSPDVAATAGASVASAAVATPMASTHSTHSTQPMHPMTAAPAETFELQRRKPASGVPRFIAVVALAFVGGVGIAFAIRRATAEEPSPAATPSGVPSPRSPVVAAPSTPPTNDVPVAVASSVAASSVAAPLVEEALIHVETVPSRASIFVAGAKAGTSPLDLKLPKGTEAIGVEIRHAGYQTVKERVVPDVNQRLKINLTRDSAPAHAAPGATAPYHKFE